MLILLGLPKAQYAVAYFTEMGIGCQRDPLEANVWYVRAADQDEPRAKTRLAAIQAVYSGKHQHVSGRSAGVSVDLSTPQSNVETQKGGSEGKMKKRWKVF
jgi:TPR repeat protein